MLNYAFRRLLNCVLSGGEFISSNCSLFRHVLFLVAIGIVFATEIILSQSADKPDRTPFAKCWSRPASVVASAGIAADQVQGYFAADDGKVSAVDLKTGEIVWTTEVGGKVSSEILVTAKAIYAVSGTSQNAASAPNGSILRSLSRATGLANWSVQLPFTEWYFIGDTPAGIVVTSAKGDVWSMNEADGTVIWKSAVSGNVASSPRYGDEAIVIGTPPNKVEVLAVSNGIRLSSIQMKHTPTVVASLRSSTVVYADDRGGIYSSETGGQQNWKFRSGGRIVYVRMIEDKILVGSADNFIYFIDVDYGNIIWKRRLPGRVAHGGIIGKDLAAFTVIGERSAFVIDLDTGRIVDQLTLTGDDAYLLTPIKANGIYLLAATATGISAFSSVCGK